MFLIPIPSPGDRICPRMAGLPRNWIPGCLAQNQIQGSALAGEGRVGLEGLLTWAVVKVATLNLTFSLPPGTFRLTLGDA